MYKIVAINKRMATDKVFIDGIKIPFVAISIFSPGAPFYRLPETSFCKDVLYLEFHDINYDGDVNSFYRVDMNDLIHFSEFLAKRIVDFVLRYKHDVNDILINCEAGMSRSVAVALAVSKILNGEDSDKYVESLYDKRFYNTLIYDTIINFYNKNTERYNNT